MAREAIEAVRAAETQAEHILQQAQEQADRMVNTATAKVRENKQEQYAAAMRDASCAERKMAELAAEQTEKIKQGAQEQCAIRRAKMLEKKENIIAKIIDAVKG